MNWLQKIAYDWQDKIREVNTKRDAHRQQAEHKAEELGHALSPWTPMNSSMCKKCGSTVFLHNIHGMTDGEDISGRAWTDKCEVDFGDGYQPCFGQELVGAHDPGTRII